MPSRGKKKTTMAKLNRETRLRERRLDKQARKEARRLASEQGVEEPVDALVHQNPDGAPPPNVGETHAR